jgi:heterotetrameric sarcosine oxidase gamma subunit
MTVRGNAIVTDVTVSTLPSAPLWAFEIWSNPDAVATRFATATGFALPKMGSSGGNDALRLIRYEPTVWLVEGDAARLPSILEMDGALTAIGGGITRVLLSGSGWRRLLMEGGVFDAESPTFTAGCSASTIIDHVNIRLHVLNEDSCLAYVPLSYTQGIIHFWLEAATAL